MLAKTYGSSPSCLYTPGMIVQPKLNGIRALYHNGTFTSRDGETWSPNCLLHLKHELQNFRDVVLDGELYIHGQPLQTINSRCAVVRQTPHPEEDTVEFHIFDYISREDNLTRCHTLTDRLRNSSLQRTRCVCSILTSSELEANSHYLAFKKAGYEGMMYRDPLAPYALPDNCKRKDLRTSWLLKRKDWLDLDAIIVGMGEGLGKHSSTMSYFNLDYNGIQFEVSSGPTDQERLLYYKLGPRLFGQRCKIEYRELTPDGKPFHCRIVQVELPKGFELI